MVDTDLSLAAELDDVLDAHVAPLLVRDQVPSAREVAGGGALAYEFRPLPPTPELVRVSRRQRFTDRWRSLDPRSLFDRGQRLPFFALAVIQQYGSPTGFDAQAFALMLVFIKADLGFDLSYLLTIQALLGVVTVATGPFAGWVADRVKRVWLIRVGTIVENLALLATAFAPTIGVLTATRVVGGLGPAAYTAAVQSVVADSGSVTKRPRLAGFMSVTANAWQTVATLVLVAGLVKFGVSWRICLGGLATVTLLLSLTTFWLREPLRGGTDRAEIGLDPTTGVDAPLPWSEAWRVTASVQTLRRLWYATPFLTVANVGAGSLLIFAFQRKLVLDPHAAGFLSDPSFAKYALFVFVLVPRLLTALLLPYAADMAVRIFGDRPGRIMVWYGLVFMAGGIGTVGIVLIPYLPLALLLMWIVSAVTLLVLPAQVLVLSQVLPARVRSQGLQTTAPWSLVGYLFLPVIGSFAGKYGPDATIIGLIPFYLIGGFLLMSSGAHVGRDIKNALTSSAAEAEVQAARERGAGKMLSCRQVEVFYEGTQVLFGVDLDVEQGEILAVLGTNGSGKSTLLRAIAGLHQATNGAVFFDGRDITHKPAHLNARDGVVLLPGGRAVFPLLTVAENLRAAAWLVRDDEQYVSTRTEEVLGFFPALTERLNTAAGNLSGGEQQQLALAQAFLMKPRLLMIDELSLGLAPAIVERLLAIVREIRAQGTTVLLVEQSVNVALTIADRAVFLDKGEVRFDGPTSELLSRHDLLRAVFLGGSPGKTAGLRVARGPGVDEAPDQVLAVADLALRYGGVQALNAVSLEVFAGEVVGVIGPNGAGKTTLFDVISGFTEHDAGQVLIAGADATWLPPDARARLGLGRSFQDPRLFPSLTVRANVAVALEQRLESRHALLSAVWAPRSLRSERSAARRVENLLESLNLGRYGDKFVSELSTGSRRMVELACLLATEPKILLLDEPSSGLAQAEIEVLGPTVQRLARESGCGVLLIEHDMPLIEEMSDRLVALELGTVIARGSPQTVLSDLRVLSSYLSASPEVLQRSGGLDAEAALGAPQLSPQPADASPPSPTKSNEGTT